MKDYVRIPQRMLNELKQARFKNKLEKLAEVKVNFNEEVEIETDDPIKMMKAKEIVKAFGRGFSMDDSLNLLDDEFICEIIDVTDYAGKSKSRILTLKGRVIGAEGKSRKLIEKNAEVKIAIYGKTISIIGRWDRVNVAKKAVDMLLSGSLHTTVNRFLEQKRR